MQARRSDLCSPRYDVCNSHSKVAFMMDYDQWKDLEEQYERLPLSDNDYVDDRDKSYASSHASGDA